VLAGYLLSGIPDGQGIFLKSHLWRPQGPGLGLRCEMRTHSASRELCKTQAHPRRASSVYGRREACPGRVYLGFFLLASACQSVYPIPRCMP
jgi:hypothetical protein